MNKEIVSESCTSCGLTFGWNDNQERPSKLVIDHISNKLSRYCKRCTSPGAAVPDVWYGYGSGIHTEENICDPKTGKPIPFYDKHSKAAAMKQAGIREAGDKIHGSRNEEYLNRKTYI